MYKEGATIAEASSDKRGLMMTLTSLGEVLALEGKLDEAKDGLHRALALAEQLRDEFSQATALINLGIVDCLDGNRESAVHRFQRGLVNGANIGSTYVVVSCLDGLAAAVSDIDLIQAARLFAASDNLREGFHLPRSSVEQVLYQPLIDAIAQKLTCEQQTRVTETEVTLADVVVAAEAAVGRACCQRT